MVENCAQLLDSIPDIESMFERKSKQEVQAILEEYLSTDKSSEATSRETQKYNNTSDTKVDQAFAELMNGS
jgi:bacterioferritin (cytochrome b1)